MGWGGAVEGLLGYKKTGDVVIYEHTLFIYVVIYEHVLLIYVAIYVHTLLI